MAVRAVRALRDDLLDGEQQEKSADAQRQGVQRAPVVFALSGRGVKNSVWVLGRVSSDVVHHNHHSNIHSGETIYCEN